MVGTRFVTVTRSRALSRLRAHHYSESQEEQLRRRARTGRPFETVDLQVVDEGGRQVPWDDREVGEIRVRGETVSPGYWRRPEETNAAYRDGWLYTGDMARIDALAARVNFRLVADVPWAPVWDG